MEKPKRDGRKSIRVPDPKTMGGRVQILREARGWSQSELAKSAGLSQPTVANFEVGKVQGGLAMTISKLAKALNVAPEWLRTGQGDPNPRVTTGTPAAEAAAIYGRLSEPNRAMWLEMGRTLLRHQK